MVVQLTQNIGLGRLLPYIALSGSAIIALAFPAAVDSWARWVFLASVVLLGLPHGAVDHVVMARLSATQVLSPKGVGLVALYALSVGVMLALWLFAPTPVFMGFILLTWFHWGQGDAWFIHAPPFKRQWWATMLSRGSLPMLVPLVFHQAEYFQVARDFAGAAGVDLPLYTESVAVSVAAGLVVVGCVMLEMISVRRVVIEPIFLIAFFAIAPPIFAIAIYFCFWHASRHLVRLAAEFTQDSWPGFATVLTWSIPLTIVSLTMLAALFFAIETQDLFSVYLALIAALTVPHVAVVCWQDSRSSHELDV